jgi:hypothetical protein
MGENIKLGIHSGKDGKIFSFNKYNCSVDDGGYFVVRKKNSEIQGIFHGDSLLLMQMDLDNFYTRTSFLKLKEQKDGLKRYVGKCLTTQSFIGARVVSK